MRRAVLLPTIVPLILALFALTACAPRTDDGESSPTTSPAPGPTAPAGAGDPARYLLATQAESDGLVVVDPADRDGSAVVDRIEVGEAPWGVAVHAATRRAYVATARGVAVVDLDARERVAVVPYRDAPSRVSYGEYRLGGTGIAVSPDGRRVYVAVNRGDASTLETVDVASRRVVASTPVGLRPFDVLVSADGREAYTVDHDAFSVHVVDTRTFEARRIEVAPFGTEGGLASFEKPHYAVLDDDGTLLLPYQGRVVVRLDPATGRTSTIPQSADSHQHGVTRTPDGSLKAVLAGGYTQSGAWDGATVVDLATLETYEIQIPGRPQVVVPLPEGPTR